MESNKGTGSAGYVIDHKNGSYTGILRAFWTGSPLVKISMSFPKETIGLFVNNLLKNGMLFKIYGVYKNDSGGIGYGKCGIHPYNNNICNLTSQNYGMTWYCTLPETKGFSCKDWFGPKSEMTTTFSAEENAFLK